MKHIRSTLAISLLVLGMAAPVMAQNLTSPPYMTADHNMRSSKLMGMPVFNERGEKIGSIDDILLPAAGGDVTAVLSVGGYVGAGTKLVKVPLSHVRFGTDKPMMPADKMALSAMPNYNYLGAGG